MVRGGVRYSLMDTNGEIELRFEDPVNVTANDQPYIQFKLLNGQIVYNHWDAGIGAYESVNHPLTGQGNPAYLFSYAQFKSTEALVLN